MGGKRKNMSNAKRAELAEQGAGRGPAGKTIVAGMKDRDTNQVVAKVVASADKPTIHGFLATHVSLDATIYTDDALVYETLPNPHEAVKHSVAEYVRGKAHTNGVESFWSVLKRAHAGTFHKISPKHLDRYVQEFAGKHNVRDLDTLDQMRSVVGSWAGPCPTSGSSGTTDSPPGRGPDGSLPSKASANVSGVAPAKSRFGSSIGGRMILSPDALQTAQG